MALDDSDFAMLGASFEQSGAPVATGRAGSADARVFGVRDAVDHAVAWMASQRRRGRRQR